MSRRIGVYPGTFDPVTDGHMDIIRRATSICDHLIVGCARNAGKGPLFSLDERRDMIAESVQHLDNVRIVSISKLLVEVAHDVNATAIVKGLRAVSDFDYELQMAQMNQQMSGIDTFFISTSPQYSFLSSSLVREVARFGGDVTTMVPPSVATRLVDRFPEPGVAR